jgi:hypothetical protein
MISVKCPACGLVDWNTGDCKRCGTSLVGLDADGNGGYGYFSKPFDVAGQARTVRGARIVMAVCAVFVLGLSALGALYLAHKPSRPQWFWSFYRSEPTAAEIFAHNLEVGGGAARVKTLRSFRAEGRLIYAGSEIARVARAAGGNVTIVMHAKEPNKVETEIEIGAPKSSDSMFAAQQPSLSDYLKPAAPKVTLRLRRGFDGERGWEYAESMTLTPGSTVPIKRYTSRELEGNELEQIKRHSPMANLVHIDDEYKGLRLSGRVPVTWSTQGQLTPSGQVLVDNDLRGHEAYVVSGMNKAGKEEKFYFDTLTGLMLRANYGEEVVEGKAFKMDCIFGDYQEVGGIKLPHRFYFKNGEESMTLTIEKYIPNDPIPDSTFEMPE